MNKKTKESLIIKIIEYWYFLLGTTKGFMVSGNKEISRYDLSDLIGRINMIK